MNIRKLLKLLYVQVLIGLVLGITVGHYWPEFGAALKPLGDGFVKLVKMMIAPIVFCTIVSGITSLNDSKEIGKTLLKSMGLFYALTILALLTGLVAVFLLQPGAGMHIDPKHLDAAVAAQFANQVPPHGFTEFVLHIIPNVVLRRLRRRRGAAGAAAGGALRLRPDAHRRGRPRRCSTASTASRTCCSRPSASSCGWRRSARSARWRSPSGATASSRSARSAC